MAVSQLSAPLDLSPLRLSAAEPSLHNDSQTLSQAPPLSTCGLLPPLALLTRLMDLLAGCLLRVDSAANDSPYLSLNTALLASQPYTRRSRISRLAPVLKKMLSSYIKLESRSPEGSVFRHLITKS